MLCGVKRKPLETDYLRGLMGMGQQNEDSKTTHGITLGACFGLAFGAAANGIFGNDVFGFPLLTLGLLVGGGVGWLYGDKVIKTLDN